MKTTPAAWTPTPRRYTPEDLASALRIGPAPDYPALASAVLDAYDPDKWGLRPEVWAVEEAPDGLWAVLVPFVDISGRTSAYHQLACLDLGAFAGAVVVQEGYGKGLATGGREEARIAFFTSADGAEGSELRLRANGRTLVLDGLSGCVAAFLRAALGRRFRQPLPPELVECIVRAGVSGGDDDLLDTLLCEGYSDAEFVDVLGFAEGVPAELLEQLYPRRAYCLADVVPGLAEPGVRGIAMTDALVDWLGEDFFRVGAQDLMPSPYLVRASWAALRVADPDDERGSAMRRRMARMLAEAPPEAGLARALDEVCEAQLVATLLFSPEGPRLLAAGVKPGAPPEMRKFYRALRALFHDCDPRRPDVPLLARRMGVLAEAAEGKFAAAA